MLINRIRPVNIFFTIVSLLLLTACGGVTIPSIKENSDGEIAYLRLTDGYWQAWITDSVGANHRQLTFDKIDKTRVSWGVERKRLLVNNNSGALFFVDVNTGEISAEVTKAGMLDAQLSPDGTEISYSLSSTQNSDNNDIWLMSSNATNKRKVVSQPGLAINPSWSADGNLLAYCLGSNRSSYQLWRSDLRTGDRVQLTVSKSFKFDPSYGPHNKLAYADNVSGNYDIWVMDDETSKPEKITQNPVYDANPSWSLDGRKIVFYSLRENTNRIWVKDLENNNVYPITPKNAASRSPAWYR